MTITNENASNEQKNEAKQHAPACKVAECSGHQRGQPGRCMFAWIDGALVFSPFCAQCALTAAKPHGVREYTLAACF